MENSTAFIDGLIWNTCPATLSIYGYAYNPIKYLCEKLADKKLGDECCCEAHLCNKYWWHNIEDFEVKHENKDMKEKLTSLPKLCWEYQRRRHGPFITFQWRRRSYDSCN
ncbi:hypothetical protein SOVF_152920, partial [Spinacia oleracea]